MTGIIKRILSAVLAVAMLLTIASFVAVAEEKRVKVLFTVGEADENGIFTAELSLHNTTFLGMQFGITFNKDAIVAVDEEGNPAQRFGDAITCYPYILNEAELNFMQVNTKLSNEDGIVQVASVMAQSKGEKLVVGEEGFIAYEFRFKEISEDSYDFDLADYPYGIYEKEAIISNDGAYVSLDFEFVCPDGKKYEFDRENKVPEETKPEDSKPGGNQSVGMESGNSVSEAERLREERKAGTVVLQINNHKVSLNGALKWVDKDNKNVVPYIENDRTMVPLRFISEALGAEVEWVAETRTIHISLEETKISMQIDNKEYTINGETKEMDVAPVIREDRTFVPLRFVSEALNKSVYWNGVTSIVVIAPLDKPWDDKDPVTQQLMTDTLMMFRWFDEEAYAN